MVRAKLQPYRNRSGRSGVSAYAIGRDFILIEFGGGHVYRYDYAHTGRGHVEAMKQLARRGKGLATYVSTRSEVKKSYARKLG